VDVLRYFVYGPKTIHPVIAAGLPVMLHEREGFFLVNFESFDDQLLAIVGTSH
jgi:hypothetical protein